MLKRCVQGTSIRTVYSSSLSQKSQSSRVEEARSCKKQNISVAFFYEFFFLKKYLWIRFLVTLIWELSYVIHWNFRFWVIFRNRRMLPQRLKKTMTDNPKKLANLIDLVNLTSTVRDFVGQSQTSRLGCFMRVWSYIKTNNLQVTFSSFTFDE